MPWVLEWRARGARRTYPLPWPRGSVLVGRPKRETLPLIPESVRKGYGVYIIPVEPPGVPVYTFIDDDPNAPTVSRHHVLITVEGDELVITDHGPEGQRSTNGTFVNGRMLPWGGSTRVRGSATIRLGRYGPEFTVRLERETVAETITVTPGVPTRVPEEVALELERRGAVEESRPAQGGRQVVLRRFEGVIESGGVQVRVEAGGDRVAAALESLLDALREAERLAESGGSAREIVGLIDVSVYRETLESMDKNAAARLTHIISMIRAGLVAPEDLLEDFRGLRRTVERLLDVRRRGK